MGWDGMYLRSLVLKEHRQSDANKQKEEWWHCCVNEIIISYLSDKCMGSDACAQIIELTSNMDNNEQMYDDPQIFSIYTRPSLKC